MNEFCSGCESLDAETRYYSEGAKGRSRLDGSRAGQAASALTNAARGMSLSAVPIPYYRHIMPYGLKKFARFARVVWGISKEGITDGELAAEGIDALEKWIDEIGAVNSISELGAGKEMPAALAEATILLAGCCRSSIAGKRSGFLRYACNQYFGDGSA